MDDKDYIKSIQKILKESTGINFKMPTEIIHPETLPVYYGQRDGYYKVRVWNCPICSNRHIYDEKSVDMVVTCPKRHKMFRLLVKGIN